MPTSQRNGDQRRHDHRQHRAAARDQLRRGRRRLGRRHLRATRDAFASRRDHPRRAASLPGARHADHPVVGRLHGAQGGRRRGPEPSRRRPIDMRPSTRLRPGLVAYFIDAVVKAGRCARRKERIWRTARGIRSLGSFHGKQAHFGFRRQHHGLHGDGVRMRRNVVRQDQYRASGNCARNRASR